MADAVTAIAGHDVHVDTTLHVGHHKGPKVWWPEDARTHPVSPECFEAHSA
jgi:hypothetical protein